MHPGYDDILQGPNVVDLTNIPNSSGINLIDRHEGRQYAVSSDAVIKALLERVEQDMRAGRMASWRFEERSYDRTAGLNLVIDASKIPMTSRGVVFEQVCRHLYTRIQAETDGPSNATLVFAMYNEENRVFVTVPNVRMSFSDRAQLVPRLGAQGLPAISFSSHNPVAMPTMVLHVRPGMFEASGCITEKQETPALSQLSVFLPSSHVYAATLRDARSDFVPPSEAIELLTMQNALAHPQVAYAKQLIDFIVAALGARGEPVPWDELIACLLPLRRDNPFNIGPNGLPLTDAYKLLATSYVGSSAPNNSTTPGQLIRARLALAPEADWSAVMAALHERFSEREPSTIDLIYRVLALSRGADQGRQYMSLRDRFISNYLRTTVRRIQRFDTLDLGAALYFLICHRYATWCRPTIGVKTEVLWYEFVDESMDDGCGWLYKWRPTVSQFTTRHSLLLQLRALVLELAGVYRDISARNAAHEPKKGAALMRVLGAEVWVDPAKQDDKLLPSECDVYIKAFNEAAKRIGEATNIGGIYQHAESLLTRNKFFASMDTNPRLIGTRDGVVALGLAVNNGEAVIVRGYHNHAVSKSVQARVVEASLPTLQSEQRTVVQIEHAGHFLDAETRSVMKMRDVWRDYFYEDEGEAGAPVADWTLMYLAQALDGEIKAAILLCWIATGRAAKTFWSALFTETMGLATDAGMTPQGYAVSINNALLTTSDKQRNANEHSTALIALEGRRAGVISENARGQAFATDMLKKLYGQETISGRRLRENERNFVIAIVALLVSNHDIEPDSCDTGSRRRIRLYRPKRQYVDDPDPAKPYERLVDPSFNKELRQRQSTRDAFFTLLVGAHTRLQREYGGDFERVPLPPVVRRETLEMLQRYDPIYRFALAKLAVVSRDRPRTSISQSDMCTAYRMWADGESNDGGAARKGMPSYAAADVALRFMKDAPVSVLDRFIDNPKAADYRFVGLRLRKDDMEPLEEGEIAFCDYNVI